MSLRVNLILPAEQRSGGALSIKSLSRIGIIILPIMLLLTISYFIANAVVASTKLRVLEDQWFRAEPLQERAENLNKQLNDHRKIKTELEGWKNTHINWHPQFAELQNWVPSTIQLQSVAIKQMLPFIDEQYLARVFSLRIRGIATTASAYQDVETLRNTLHNSGTFTGIVETVKVSDFEEDVSRGANSDSRVFEIECKYLPRIFLNPERR